MKAFMSDRITRGCIIGLLWPISRKRTIDAAINEAKRILAETESLEAFTYGQHRFEGQYVKTELSRAYDGQGHRELREALANFVAD